MGEKASMGAGSTAAPEMAIANAGIDAVRRRRDFLEIREFALLMELHCSRLN
jgi:hypothetical protein